MTYFSKEFSAEVILPDGTAATSVYEVDRYLKANGLACATEYSEEYYKNIRAFNENRRRADVFAAFLKNYKKRIWNE